MMTLNIQYSKFFWNVSFYTNAPFKTNVLLLNVWLDISMNLNFKLPITIVCGSKFELSSLHRPEFISSWIMFIGKLDAAMSSFKFCKSCKFIFIVFINLKFKSILKVESFWIYIHPRIITLELSFCNLCIKKPNPAH